MPYTAEAVTVTQVATGIVAVQLVDGTGRGCVTIKNDSLSRLWLKQAANVSPTDGFPIEAGEIFTDDRGHGPWYGVLTADAGTADVMVWR